MNITVRLEVKSIVAEAQQAITTLEKAAHELAARLEPLGLDLQVAVHVTERPGRRRRRATPENAGSSGE